MVMSKSKSSTRARYCTASTSRRVASMPSVAEILQEGRVVRLERRLVEQKFDLEDVAVRQPPLAVLDDAAGIAEQLRRLAQQGAVLPRPSDTGGTKGSPNTSSGTLPRNGSSSLSSSGDGGPSPPCPNSGTAKRCAHRRHT